MPQHGRPLPSSRSSTSASALSTRARNTPQRIECQRRVAEVIRALFHSTHTRASHPTSLHYPVRNLLSLRDEAKSDWNPSNMIDAPKFCLHADCMDMQAETLVELQGSMRALQRNGSLRDGEKVVANVLLLAARYAEKENLTSAQWKLGPLADAIGRCKKPKEALDSGERFDVVDGSTLDVRLASSLRSSAERETTIKWDPEVDCPKTLQERYGSADVYDDESDAESSNS